MNEGVIWHLSESCHRFLLSSSYTYRGYGWDQGTTGHSYKASSLFTTATCRHIILTGMGCFHSQIPSVEQLQNTEALSDEYVEKVTHISADITEVGHFYCFRCRLRTCWELQTNYLYFRLEYLSQIIKKNKRQPGEGSKDVRGTPPDQSPCPVVRVQSVTDSPVLPHKHDLSPAISDSLDIS